MSQSPLAHSLFTAARLSVMLGLAKRSVLLRLKAVPASGTVIAAGNAAQAWTFADLPEDYRRDLSALARRRGYRDVFAMITDPPKLWAPEIPLTALADKDVTKARKLQTALGPVLARIGDDKLTEAELHRLGCNSYREAFGFEISARQVGRLLDRTMARDAGREDWDRLEIYLDERVSQRPLQPGCNASAIEERLSEALGMFKDRSKPTRDEAAFLWSRAFELFEERQASGASANKCRNEVLAALFALAPFLAKSPESLRKLFVRNFGRWTSGGRRPEAVADQRAERSGRYRRADLPQADRDLIIGHAALHTGGRVSQAFRELRDSQQLSPELLNAYPAGAGSKSYVPRSIRLSVSNEVRMLADPHHGPRQTRLNGAHMDRDWSGVHAGDWYQADDVTLPVYYYEPDGNGWFTLWRGQFLVMTDVRSGRVLGFVLMSSRNYNSRAIRTLITRTADEHGLPRRGFYFERGIWQSSRLLSGQKSETLPLSDAETEKGLRDLGLEFRHALLPRAKTVERIIGILQNQMEREPGYVGRDEINDRFERVQQQKLAVEAKRIHPAQHFLSVDQWEERLQTICERYNAEVQQGKMLDGLSPDEGFARLQDEANPAVKFDARCRFLLSHHRKPVRVTRNGIAFRIGKESFVYRNAETGRHIGETMLAWWNPETPEVLCVSDLNREHVFAVERSNAVPAMDASPEQMATEMARINAHGAYARERYRVLKAKHRPAFRSNAVTQDVASFGQDIRKKTEALKTEKAEARRTEKALRSISASTTEELLDAEPETRAQNVDRLAALLSPERGSSIEELL